MAQPTPDHWDIVTDVGLTALIVASGRAVDTHRTDGLINDPFAELFVAAAHPPVPLPVRPTPPRDDSEDEAWQMMSGYLGVRTRRFDETLLAARTLQVVIVAAGLDSRALRLPWPAGTTVYEIDQPAVLGFKDEVLDASGAVPTSDRRVVPADLREDWPTALVAAGFDREQPTAWLIEGLLPYLPAAAETALLRSTDELSAPGSMIVIENFTNLSQQTGDPVLRRMADRFGLDMAALLPDGDREDAGRWLARHGWHVDTERATDAASVYGRELDALTRRLNGDSEFITARC